MRWVALTLFLGTGWNSPAIDKKEPVEPSTNFVFKLSGQRKMRIKRIAFGTTNVLRIDLEGKVHRVGPAKVGKQFKGEENHLTIWNTSWRGTQIPPRTPHHRRRRL